MIQKPKHLKNLIQIYGRVVHGKKYGSKLGFPTANIDRRDYVRRKLKIKLGVWAGRAELKIKKSKLKIYPAAIVIGPTDNKGLPKLEAHLIGFKGNLYGIYMNIYLNIYLRPFRKFKNQAALIRQIHKDINQIKKLSQYE